MQQLVAIDIGEKTARCRRSPPHEAEPDQPVVQYHLGLASLKAGDKQGARKALTAAINSPGSLAEKDEAKKALAAIQ